MNHKILGTIQKYSMLKQGDTVIAAVSGGADSVALLHFLSGPDLQIKIRACHLNHCLRGEESDRDERLVRTMCREYGIPLDVRRADVASLARQEKCSVELAARKERYRFFEELAQIHGAKIATAHTLSDLTETVLFHLARGTGLDGLCGIPPVRGCFIRPLLACTRPEIEAYCIAHDLAYVNDSTNALDDYTRNFIRHNVIPPFTEVNEGALRAVERMTTLIREDASFLYLCTQEQLAACRRGKGLDAALLRQAHPAMRSRMILALLKENGAEVSEQRVRQAEEVLSGRQGALCIGKNIRLAVRDGIFLAEAFRQAPVPQFRETRLLKKRLDGSRIRLPGGRLLSFSVFSAADYEIFKNNGDIDLKCALDYDMMENDIVVRSRRQGDRIRPAGRGCFKSLKKLYNELAVPDRDTRCVIADRGGVLFAEGAGADERAAMSSGSKTIVMVKITEGLEHDGGY